MSQNLCKPDVAMTWILVSSLASCGSGTVLAIRAGFTLGLAESMGARNFDVKNTPSIKYLILTSKLEDWVFIFYTRLGVSLSTGPIYVQSSPQFGSTLSTFCGPNLATCKVMRSHFRSQYS